MTVPNWRCSGNAWVSFLAGAFARSTGSPAKAIIKR
jgi:hypothetical protein